MRLLLDTHAFLWWDNDELPPLVTHRIQQADEVYVSAVSAWEIAIKVGLGKLTAKVELASAIADYGFLPLPISLEHAGATRKLPTLHRDPFDRMLIAQAIFEQLVLVTDDRLIRAYRVKTLWT